MKKLYLILCFLVLFDIISTYLSLNLGASEGSLISIYLLNKNAFLPIKIASILILGIGIKACLILKKKAFNVTYLLLLFFNCGILASAVVNNIIVLKGVI